MRQRATVAAARAPSLPEAAILTALTGEPSGLDLETLIERLAPSVGLDAVASACEALLERGAIIPRGGTLELTGHGGAELLAFHGELERALDPSPTTPGMEECPSIPWLTTVQTHWIDAVSLNYAVDPAALAALLPRPLEPEIHNGSAWVQLLVSSLKEMRPQGAPALFGVNFHQASYRAAVRFREPVTGRWRRGGYFVRSETDHAVMRAIGNALVEFRFHEFGLARMALGRDGDRLRLQIDPVDAPPHGRVEATFDRRPAEGPPPGSVWRSREELAFPLVECFDAFGVDATGWVYVLTVDRDPWDERFVAADVERAEFFEDGPLGGGASRLDSVLHVPAPCAYRWRPLRRERFEP